MTAIPPPELVLLPFKPADQAQVKDLILAGMVEHWGVLDPSKNPDLNDIGASYAGAVFLVAWQQNRVIGTGALVPRSNDTAEIVRMSVAAGLRRQGLGRRILLELCRQARSAGYRKIVLETTQTWDGAIAFYKRLGFRVSHHVDDEIYFVLDLSD